jgi:hypothetical protein
MDRTRASDKVKALGTQTRQDIAAPVRSEVAQARLDAQEATRYDRAYSSATTALDRSRQPIFDQYRRAQRLIDTLHQPGGALDAVAVPEFLTVMAGGFGSGLRMSDTELKRIFGAQTVVDEFKTLLGRWGPNNGITDVPPLFIQPQMRANMKRAGELFVQRTDALLSMYEDYDQKFNDATTAKEVGALRAEMRKAEHAAAASEPSAAPNASTAPTGTPSGPRPTITRGPLIAPSQRP